MADTNVASDINLSQVKDKDLARILQSMYRGFANAVNNLSQNVSPSSLPSWTPVLRFAGSTTGIVYASGGQSGQYQVNGKILTCWCYVALTSKGTATGQATLSGLPFTTAKVPGPGGAAAPFYEGMAGINGTFVILPGYNNTIIDLNIQGSTGWGHLNDTNFTDTSRFTGMFQCLLP